MALHLALTSLAAGPVTGPGVGPTGTSPVSAAASTPPVRLEVLAILEDLDDRVRSIRVESS